MHAEWSNSIATGLLCLLHILPLIQTGFSSPCAYARAASARIVLSSLWTWKDEACLGGTIKRILRQPGQSSCDWLTALDERKDSQAYHIHSNGIYESSTLRSSRQSVTGNVMKRQKCPTRIHAIAEWQRSFWLHRSPAVTCII